MEKLSIQYGALIRRLDDEQQFKLSAIEYRQSKYNLLGTLFYITVISFVGTIKIEWTLELKSISKIHKLSGEQVFQALPIALKTWAVYNLDLFSPNLGEDKKCQY